jgi:flagellar assembly protein FliH
MPLQATPSGNDRPRIVKARAALGLGTPIAFNYRDLQDACDEHLAEVRAQSQKVLDATTADTERIRREAIDAGRRAGYQEGLKAAEQHVAERVARLAAERLAQQLETVLPAVRQLADHLVRQQDHWVARWERDALRLSVAIAEKLLHRTLAADPANADAMIADTLRIAAGTPAITVRLAPADLERLGENVGQLVSTIEKLGEAQVVGDARVAPGGCVVETRHGQIDGRLETMLERIAAELCGDASHADDAKSEGSP